eukprot:4417586-Prymnesium_polylepis.1
MLLLAAQASHRDGVGQAQQWIGKQLFPFWGALPKLKHLTLHLGRIYVTDLLVLMRCCKSSAKPVVIS